MPQQNDPLYAAAQRVINAGLANDDSAFTPGRPVWTAAVAEDLVRRFVDAPETGSASFTDKLGRQLAEAPQETVQLAAELVYLHLLAPDDFGAVAKRDLLHTVLGLAPESVQVPPGLDDALDSGFSGAGTAYRTYRDRQLAWLVRFVVAWKRLSEADRNNALNDPWAFRAVADSIDIHSAYSQRNVLLHLAFPGTFAGIASRTHKQLIVTRLAAYLPGKTPTRDEDRDLVEIHAALERERGGPVSFYDQDVKQLWYPGAAPSGTDAPELRGWLVRGANVHGRNLVPEWLDRGYCSLAYPEVGEVAPGSTRAQISALLAEQVPEWTTRQRAVHAGVLYRFLTEMRPGDLVATVGGGKVYVGRITGHVQWIDTPDRLNSRRRPVRWENVGSPFTRDQLSPAAQDRLRGQMTVSGLDTDVAEFAALAGIDPDLDPDVDDPPSAPAPGGDPVELPTPPLELAKSLFVDHEWLAETVDLLDEKKQLVLYGPPGTGKTYLAQELARFLTEQTGGADRLVQFHPSYAYEDFFEGFRPQRGSTPGTVAFELEPGPLRQLAAEAHKDHTRAHVLIIDEINRANLAKVFGELYFLLEYRDRSVQLQYSPTEDFRLPPNLYVIGTMNTADRSIALVDAAMRRRFAWQGLFPQQPPVNQMLRRWLQAHGLPMERADLLDTLNDRLGDRDAAVGPSYLMTPRAGDDAGLARIWKHHIMPLLEEYHIGDDIDLPARYGIDALRKAAAPPTTGAAAGPAPDAAMEETGEEL